MPLTNARLAASSSRRALQVAPAPAATTHPADLEITAPAAALCASRRIDCAIVNMPSS